MDKKPRMFFNRISGKANLRKWWKLRNSGFQWKKESFQLWFVDEILFKIVSFVEAVVLVSTLCLYFLFCGCHI